MLVDYRLNPLRRGRKAFRDGLQIETNPYHQRLHREWWERGWREVEKERAQGKEMTWKRRKEMMKPSTQIEISAQVWVCDACGCQDAKSCGCNSPAHWEKLLENREKKRKQK
jgi:hypothetical protein